MDLVVGLLVLITGVLVYSFSPGQPLFVKPPGHVTTHWIGGGLGVVVGIVGLAVRKKTSTVGLVVSILAVVLALVFILDAPGYPVSSMLQPHGLAMEGIGGLTAVVGIVGILAGLALKPKTT